MKINDSDKWNEFAIANGLKTTIGSDFHSIDNIHPIIGLIGEDLDVNTIEIVNFLSE